MDSEYAILVGSAVTTITLDSDYREVEIVNVDGAEPVYFTVDGAVPTIRGAGTSVLPKIAGATRSVISRSAGATVVRLISVGTPTVGVIAYG